MKYMGSKRRIAKDILPIMLRYAKENNIDTWVEPFVGGGNMMEFVSPKFKRIGSDYNKYLIALYKGLQNKEEIILDIPKSLFDKARNQFNGKEQNGFNDFQIGWIGFMAGFNGRFYGGGYSGIQGGRNYIKEQINNTLRSFEKIKDVSFVNCSYQDLDIPINSIIYCDPPYFGTKEYDTKESY